MCNSQYARPRSGVACGATVPATPVNTAGMMDPMADVIRENPTCNYGQACSEYMSASPDDVPVPVTPSPSMPISVQPAGPGTPVFASPQQATAYQTMQAAPLQAQPAPLYQAQPAPLYQVQPAPLYQTTPLYSAMQQTTPAFQTAILPPMTSQLTDNLPESLTNPAYIPGFLRENIGSLVRVEFLLTNNMTDRVGILREVGASYIILDALDGSSKLLCDLFSIRFVTIMQQVTPDNFQTARTIYASSRFQG